MQNLSRLSSSCKDKTFGNSKMMSSYTSHTRCQSVSKQSYKNPKKIEKLHTQMISSRKYNSINKNAQPDYFSKQPSSPYRASFSSTKYKYKKNSSNDNNVKCQSSYNLKDYSVSKQMANSTQIFSSLYIEPMEMVCLVDKDNKQSLRSTQNRKKKPASSMKNHISTKRQAKNQQFLDCYSKNSQQNLSRLFKRSKSKDTHITKDLKKIKNQKYRKNSMIFSPSGYGSKIMSTNSDGLATPYSQMLSRTFDILNKYQKKIQKLQEDKVSYQRLYEKSQIQCQNLRKSLRKKDKKQNQTNCNTVIRQKDGRRTRQSLKISVQTVKK